MLSVLCLPIQLRGQGRGAGKAQAPGRDTMHVVRVALREYSKFAWSQRLILTPRTDLDQRYGATLPLADSVRATRPTRISVNSVVFKGDTVVSVYIDNKVEGRDCYLRQRVVLGRPAGTAIWAKVLGHALEHVCTP